MLKRELRPPTLARVCDTLSLLYASKRNEKVRHFDVSQRLKQAIENEKLRKNIADCISDLRKEREDMKFQMTKENFYYIKKQLLLMLDASKNISKDCNEALEYAINQSIKDFLADFDNLTK